MNRGAISAGFLRSLILWCLVAVYAALVVLSSMDRAVGEFDEAIPLVHGVLVQNGAVPGLDFWSFYPPLGPYVSATAFRLLGRTVIATRLFDAALFLLILCMLVRLLLRHFERSDPKFVIIILVVAAAIGPALTLPAWPGFALSAVAFLAYPFPQEGRPPAWWRVGLSGALMGMALIYRVNFAAYAAAAVAGSVVIAWWSCGSARWEKGGWKRPLFTIAIFFAPMMLCSLGFCFAIYGRQMGAAVRQFTLTAQTIMAYRRFIELKMSAPFACKLFFPVGWFSLRLWAIEGKLSRRLLPAVGIGVGIVILAGVWSDRIWLGLIVVGLELAWVIGLQLWVLRLPRLELAILLLYCFHLHYYLSRADFFHSKFVPILAVWLLPFLLLESIDPGEPRNSPVFKRFSTALFVPLILFALVSQFQLSLSFRRGMSLIADTTMGPHISDADRMLGVTPPAAAWASVYPDTDELLALRYLHSVSTNAEPIFVGVQDHSRVFYNNLRIYWLAGRPIGVRQFQLETGMATEMTTQGEIIQDLNQNHVRWVILDRQGPRGDATFLRRAYVGSALLDSFILANFQEEAQFGRFAVLTRRAISPP